MVVRESSLVDRCGPDASAPPRAVVTTNRPGVPATALSDAQRIEVAGHPGLRLEDPPFGPDREQLPAAAYLVPRLGALFGVSRQAVSKWLTNGAPGERVEQVATVTAITDLLERHVKADRIPAVVRRRAPGLGDRSLLELVSQGRRSEALELTRQMFTFTDVHA